VTFDDSPQCPRCRESFALVRPLASTPHGDSSHLLRDEPELRAELRERLHRARLERRKENANPMATGSDPEAPDWFDPASSGDDDVLETASVVESTSGGREERGIVHSDDLPPDGDVRGSAMTADFDDDELESSDADTGDTDEPQFTGEIPGFSDWREELRERLKRIRARREQERLAEASDAPDGPDAHDTPDSGDVGDFETAASDAAAEDVDDFEAAVSDAPFVGDEDGDETPHLMTEDEVADLDLASAGDSEPLAEVIDLGEIRRDDESASAPEAYTGPEAYIEPDVELSADPQPEAEVDVELYTPSDDEPEVELHAPSEDEPEVELHASSEDEPEVVLDDPSEDALEVKLPAGPGDDIGPEHDAGAGVGEEPPGFFQDPVLEDPESAREEPSDAVAEAESAGEEPIVEAEPPDAFDWDDRPVEEENEVEETAAEEDVEEPAAEPELIAHDLERAPDSDLPPAVMPSFPRSAGDSALELDFEQAAFEAPASAPELDIDAAETGPDLPVEWDSQEAEAPRPRSSAGPLGERAAAAVCDLLVLLAIGAALVWAAASGTGLPFRQILFEAAPWLAVTWAIFAIGYSIFFVGSCGQTIGRMVMRLRVVGEDQFTVGFDRAAVRLAAWVVSALPAGAGLLPALRDPKRRTAHDRLSRTRVVKA
jgi:uncharacterized RDD family membrane protein YckC